LHSSKKFVLFSFQRIFFENSEKNTFFSFARNVFYSFISSWKLSPSTSSPPSSSGEEMLPPGAEGTSRPGREDGEGGLETGGELAGGRGIGEEGGGEEGGGEEGGGEEGGGEEGGGEEGGGEEGGGEEGGGEEGGGDEGGGGTTRLSRSGERGGDSSNVSSLVSSRDMELMSLSLLLGGKAVSIFLEEEREA
jgi:hypothetical protein